VPFVCVCQLVCGLLLCCVSPFFQFFDSLEESLSLLQVSGYGITITTLEEVFLKVGGDHDLTGAMASGTGAGAGGGAGGEAAAAFHAAVPGGSGGSGSGGSGADANGASNGNNNGSNNGNNDDGNNNGNDDGDDDDDDDDDDSGDLTFTEFRGQVAGLWRKRVEYASNDWLKSTPTMLLPSAAIATAFVLNLENVYGSEWKPGGNDNKLLCVCVFTCVCFFLNLMSGFMCALSHFNNLSSFLLPISLASPIFFFLSLSIFSLPSPHFSGHFLLTFSSFITITTTTTNRHPLTIKVSTRT
jgi:hypothetical protein